MRTIVLAASLTLAAASAAQSQQVQSLQNANSPTSTGDFVPKEVASSVQAPSLRPVDAPIGMTRAQAGVDAKSNALAEPSAAAVDPDTRNMLAIVGAVVIIIALVAFIL